MASWVAWPIQRSGWRADIRTAGAAYSQNMNKVDMILSVRLEDEDQRKGR